MKKKNTTMEYSKAFTILGIVLVLFIGIGFIFISNVKKDFHEQEKHLPGSAITVYMNDLKAQNYDAIYENSLLVEPHYNSKEAYVKKIASIYDGVNLDALEYETTDNSDGSVLVKLFDQKHFLTTLKLIKVDDTWLATTLFDQSQTKYYIEASEGVSLEVNGIPLKLDALVAQDVVASNFVAMNNEALAPRVDRYELLNLLEAPTVTVVGSDASSYGTLTDVTNGTIYVGKVVNDADLAKTMVDYAETCASFTANDTGLNSVLGISVSSSDWVKRIRTLQTQWFTKHSIAEFSNQRAFNLIQQSEDTVIGYTSFDFYAANSEVSRTWNAGYQMSIVKENGKWKIGAMGVCSGLNPENEYAIVE